VVSRLVSALAGDLPRALKAIRAALAGDAAPGADGGLVTVDLDATIVISHADKQDAAPTWKKTFDLLTELLEACSQFSINQARALLLTGPDDLPGSPGTRRPRW
jgi:hypothetical protein